MEFKTQLKTVDVLIDGEPYKLVETDGDKAAKYRNAVLDCMIMGPDGTPRGSKNLANTESMLVGLCLVDEDDNPVDLKKIRSWPNSVVTALAAEAKRISGLNMEEADPTLGN